MTSATLTARPRVLADAFVSSSAITNTALVVGGTALTAVLAQVSIPIWPVPITGQTLAVLLVGSTLGPVRGALSMVLYWTAGVAGAPIFSEASSGLSTAMGPSGGYIVGFIAAAYLVGKLSQRSWDRKFVGAALAFLAGTIVTFAIGMVWLAVSLGASLQQTLEWGLYPFIIGGIIKAGIAAAVIPTLWRIAPKLQK
ncbi:biotin transporter BioY [Arthrobacter sulfonylureivorans]|uniref:Biotin transporter n=1 Tax=Arthrobacter sulfonylureivorans TaxID=2486855 RepID=A0ABY3WD39_9MICC|nr:biotin transporter BioY [Arthrobacter sulfonylureivorans]UNK45634.1 biotin transporter BioY [Arthrobacter sulfonylureivorans]